MESKNMKKNLLLSGIKEIEGENCSQVVKNFFKDKLKIEEEVQIKKAFCIGKGENRQLSITLSDVVSKGVIYKHVKNLKDDIEC